MPEPSHVAEKQPDQARGRLWRALVRPTRGQLIVALLLAVVGFAGVTQVRTNTVDETYAGLREQDLIDILDGLAGTTQRAQAEIQRLEQTRDDLLSETSSREAALEAARLEAEALSIIAGTVAVRGPGVRITIKEVAGQVRVEPFLDMVQALRSAGAEAIQINGSVRVVASTSFQDVDGGILAGGQILKAPFVVDAIGVGSAGCGTPVPQRSRGPVRQGRHRRADVRRADLARHRGRARTHLAGDRRTATRWVASDQ